MSEHPVAQRLFPVIAFTVAYIVLAVTAALGSGNTEFVFYLVVMAVLIAVVFLVHGRVTRLRGDGRGIPDGVLWALSVWGLLHMAGGLLPIPEGWPREGNGRVLYNLWLIPGRLKFDQFVHAYGFGVTTVLCWYVLRVVLTERNPAAGPPHPTPGLLLLCAAAGMGFGALNEVVEFVATRFMENTNVGDYENTGWDLVSNLAGAAIAAVGIRLYHGPARTTSSA